MKKRFFLLVLLFMLCCSNVCAEKSTLYEFPEFSVYVSDDYFTITKENVSSVVGSNTLNLELGIFLDYFDIDSSLYVEAINPQSFNEMCIRCSENPGGMDWRMFNGIDDTYAGIIVNEVKENFANEGFNCLSATVFRHPQTMFVVLEGYQSSQDGYVVIYLTGAKINNKLYTISVTGFCSTNEKSERFANDIQNVVNCLNITGYPEFTIPQTQSKNDQYLSEFQLFDGERFGESYEEVLRKENDINSVEGIVYEPPAWASTVLSYVTYAKSLTYYNIPYLDIEYSSKSFRFDENDTFYSAFYEFRSGYDLELDGLDDIGNFAPDYNSVELYLRDLFGNPQYQHKKETKSEINGHGMREAIDLMGGLDNEKLFDYSEWIIEDPAGQIKVEHIMYFTGYIYKHNVSIEIIR